LTAKCHSEKQESRWVVFRGYLSSAMLPTPCHSLLVQRVWSSSPTTLAYSVTAKSAEICADVETNAMFGYQITSAVQFQKVTVNGEEVPLVAAFTYVP